MYPTPNLISIKKKPQAHIEFKVMLPGEFSMIKCTYKILDMYKFEIHLKKSKKLVNNTFHFSMMSQTMSSVTEAFGKQYDSFSKQQSVFNQNVENGKSI